MKEPRVTLDLKFSGRQTPARLRALIARVSPDVLLWIGSSQIRNASQKITSWPCENGNYPLTPVNASSLFDATMSRNRHGCVTTTPYVATGHALRNVLLPAVKHMFLLTAPKALNANRMALTTGVAFDGLGAVANATTVAWAVGAGWTFYRNGVASNDAPVGAVACYEAAKSANANTGIVLGQISSAFYNWTGENYAIAAATTALTRGQAQAIAAALVDWVAR